MDQATGKDRTCGSTPRVTQVRYFPEIRDHLVAHDEADTDEEWKATNAAGMPHVC